MKVAYPKSWNELTGRQLIRMLAILHSELSIHARKLLLLCTVLGVSLRTLRRLEPETVARCYYVLDPFLKDSVPSDTCGHGLLTNNLLPSVRIWQWGFWPLTLHGAAERLKNLTFLEFVFADSYYSQLFGKKPNPEALDKLIAVLYRPKRKTDLPGSLGYQGDVRQSFNEHLIAEHARTTARLPALTKLAIRVWYSGCRRHLENRYGEVFSEPNQKKASSSGWTQVLLDLAGTKFGDIDKTGRENLHTVLLHMNTTIQQNRELEASYKK